MAELEVFQTSLKMKNRLKEKSIVPKLPTDSIVSGDGDAGNVSLKSVRGSSRK